MPTSRPEGYALDRVHDQLEACYEDPHLPYLPVYLFACLKGVLSDVTNSSVSPSVFLVRGIAKFVSTGPEVAKYVILMKTYRLFTRVLPM